MKRFYHSDLKAHIYRQENSAQQANTFKINRKKLALGGKPKKRIWDVDQNSRPDPPGQNTSTHVPTEAHGKNKNMHQSIYSKLVFTHTVGALTAPPPPPAPPIASV